MTEIKLKNGKTVKAYPLTGSQNMMYLMSLKYGSGYPVNNIGCGYYWRGDYDKGELKASIYEAIRRCDTMRLRFVMGKKLQLHQYVTEKSELFVDEWDYSDMTVEEAQDKLTAYSRSGIPMFNCEIHKIALVKFKDGYHGLFMRIHHLAMDAYSIKVFINDIIGIYNHRTQGTAYPKPMREYIPVLEKELAYESSAQKEADKQYWFDSLAKSTEPIFTDFMLESRLKAQQLKKPEQRFADIHSGLPDADTIRFGMSAEISEKLLELCAEKSLSVFSLVSMGVRTALSCFNGNQEDVSFKMIINRRGTVAEKKSGGLRINFLPMRSIITPDTSFTEGVNIISQIQNEMYLHSTLSFLGMLKERHKSMSKDAKFDSTYDSFGLSYQPMMKMAAINEEMSKTVKSIWYNNGAIMIPLYVTVCHRAGDGGFDFILEYRREQNAEYDLTLLFGKIEKALTMWSENPDITVGEILKNIEVTQEERRGKPRCEQSKDLLKSLKITWKLTKSRVKTVLSLISA